MVSPSECEFHAHIDWERPWLAPLCATAAWFAAADAGANWRTEVNRTAHEKSIRNYRGLPIRLVDQSELPALQAYESYIGATGCVPTRNNLHDFFNALSWLAWPHIKNRLNALQAVEIERQESLTRASNSIRAHQRGGLRDALTLFDENAAIVVSSDPTLFALLRGHQWPALFIDQRSAFGTRCEVFLFGHALLEKLVTPYKAITAHAWLVTAPKDFFARSTVEKVDVLDRLIAARLRADFRPSDLTPLPVLGVPGWAAAQTPAFYRDPAVFRPRRAAPR